jgi:hypothetical protein
MPWRCTRCLPRGGVTAANFLSNCKGVITNDCSGAGVEVFA